MIQNKSFKDANQAREEIDSERLRAEAAASVLAKKTKAMQEQVPLAFKFTRGSSTDLFIYYQADLWKSLLNKVAVLTERSEKLEVRRAREAEGYQVCTYLRQEKRN